MFVKVLIFLLSMTMVLEVFYSFSENAGNSVKEL